MCVELRPSIHRRATCPAHGADRPGSRSARRADPGRPPRPLVEVARELAEAAGLAPREWQTLPLVINPPALAPAALTLMAELHGRCGYFPPILNIRPVANSTPPRYEVAEIVNLQAIRDTARTLR